MSRTTIMPGLSMQFLCEQFHAFFRRIPSAGITTLPQMRSRTFFADNAYSAVPSEQVSATMRSSALLFPVAQGREIELCDCDDYALQLKASVTAYYRMQNVNTPEEEDVYPPAVGILITRVHALNVCYGAVAGQIEVYLADASVAGSCPITAPEEAAGRMAAGGDVWGSKVKFIYM